MGLDVTEVGTHNRVSGGAAMRRGHLPIEIRGTGNVVEVGPGLTLFRDTARLRIDGDGNRIALGPGLSLRGKSRIHVVGSNNRVTIGRSCGGNMRIDVETSGAILDIGDGCTMVGGQLALHEPARMTLGKDCMLSAGVVLTVSDMHAIVDLETRTRINPGGDVHLGDHVWLGVRAVVLKGVEIGPGSVIGAGAVVSRSIPANCIAVGVPARVVRRKITWHRACAELAAHAAGELDIDALPRG